MADWPGWWRYVRECVDRSETGEVVFSVGEIIAGARAFDDRYYGRGPWNAMMNPANTSYVGVIENGIECQPLPETGRVERVAFRLAREV